MYHVRFTVLSSGTFNELLVDKRSLMALEKLHHDGNIQLFYKREWGQWNEIQDQTE